MNSSSIAGFVAGVALFASTAGYGPAIAADPSWQGSASYYVDATLLITSKSPAELRAVDGMLEVVDDRGHKARARFRFDPATAPVPYSVSLSQTFKNCSDFCLSNAGRYEYLWRSGSRVIASGWFTQKLVTLAGDTPGYEFLVSSSSPDMASTTGFATAITFRPALTLRDKFGTARRPVELVVSNSDGDSCKQSGTLNADDELVATNWRAHLSVMPELRAGKPMCVFRSASSGDRIPDDLPDYTKAQWRADGAPVVTVYRRALAGASGESLRLVFGSSPGPKT